MIYIDFINSDLTVQITDENENLGSAASGSHSVDLVVILLFSFLFDFLLE